MSFYQHETEWLTTNSTVVCARDRRKWQSVMVDWNTTYLSASSTETKFATLSSSSSRAADSTTWSWACGICQGAASLSYYLSTISQMVLYLR